MEILIILISMFAIISVSYEEEFIDKHLNKMLALSLLLSIILLVLFACMTFLGINNETYWSD
jgi:uncharacterized membrane protein